MGSGIQNWVGLQVDSRPTVRPNNMLYSVTNRYHSYVRFTSNSLLH
jgi:hypothetical protein